MVFVKTIIRNTLKTHYYAQTHELETAATRAFDADPTLSSVSPDHPIVWHEPSKTLEGALKAGNVYSSLGTPMRVLAVHAGPSTTADASQCSRSFDVTDEATSSSVLGPPLSNGSVNWLRHNQRCGGIRETESSLGE